MMGAGIYVYGVGSGQVRGEPFRPRGLPDGSGPVMMVGDGETTAIVGPHTGPALSGLPQRELMRQLAIHQRVIEDVMARGDVLPARFGTVLASEDEARSLLTSWDGILRQTLTRLSGMVEVEVAATWELDQVLPDVAASPEVAAAKAEAMSAPESERMAQQIRVGQVVKEMLDRRRASFTDRLLHEIGPLAWQSQPNAVLTDEIVFNVAFLVERSALGAFDDAVERLDKELEDSLSFRQIGPLPPYSFATMSVTRFDAERLAAGRALLGLSGEISEEAVLAAYRRLAQQWHPDRTPGDPAAAGRFAALTSARADLLAFSRSQPVAGTTDGVPALMMTIGGTADGSTPGADGDG